MFNKNDPLIDSVTKVMQENQVRRDAEKAVNEELGIFGKRALPFEMHKLYDQLLEEVIQEALSEKLVGNQHKIDVNKNNRVDAHDFKLLRSKKKVEEEKKEDDKKETSKEKEPEEHGVEAEREMASKGKKMYEENLKEKRGLWDNIHAKRKRIAAGSGEKMRKPGSEGAPTEKDLKAAQNEEAVNEVAPPSAKAERMVKYIKKGYSKDGDLSKKEKSIAYATAWKAYNKSKAKD